MTTTTPAISNPLLLLILDGFGQREATEHNAIHAARTPNLDRLRARYPHGLIQGSGEAVGLPDGQMGNSEVGHMNLGAGRVLYQDLTRISRAIANGEFFDNPVLTTSLDRAIAAGKAVHIMGLLSDGGVHSHQEHLEAMVDMAAQRGATDIQLHLFLDGRDTPPRSAAAYLERLEAHLQRLGRGRIASLIGRYYAMDRDQRWERLEAAWNLLAQGQCQYHASDAATALNAAYLRNESDEFVQATGIGSPVRMQDGDAVFFMNFRADRARALTQVFIERDFEGFARSCWPQVDFVTLTPYADSLPAPCAFPGETLHDTLGECLSRQGLQQLRIAETEKYAHVTFFFSGGREEPWPGETRQLIPSPKVATYDLQPEMSAGEVTAGIIEALRSGHQDVIIANYANGDMVGHTGNFEAAVQAIEYLDQCLGEVLEVLAERGGQALITADHGNAEQMQDPATDQAHTAHTSEPVPLIYVGERPVRIREGGVLADVAPTLLELLNLPVPEAMTGRSLLAS